MNIVEDFKEEIDVFFKTDAPFYGKVFSKPYGYEKGYVWISTHYTEKGEKIETLVIEPFPGASQYEVAVRWRGENEFTNKKCYCGYVMGEMGLRGVNVDH